MYYSGEANVPGAPGNPNQFRPAIGFHGSLIGGGPSFDIPRGPGALGGRSEEQIRRLQQSMPDNKQLLEEMQRRGITPGGGPQLPLAYSLPGAAGNMAGMLMAQGLQMPR